MASSRPSSSSGATMVLDPKVGAARPWRRRASPPGAAPGATTSAADCRPRTSPPSRSAARRAAMSRSLEAPLGAPERGEHRGGDRCGRSIMLAWTVTPGATRCEANRTHRRPVWAADRPAASTIPTWRTASSGSAATSSASASAAVRPVAQQAQAVEAVGLLAERLGRDGTHAGLHPGHDAAHAEPAGLDGDPEIPGGAVQRDDRVGHARMLRRASDAYCRTGTGPTRPRPARPVPPPAPVPTTMRWRGRPPSGRPVSRHHACCVPSNGVPGSAAGGHRPEVGPRQGLVSPSGPGPPVPGAARNPGRSRSGGPDPAPGLEPRTAAR